MFLNLRHIDSVATALEDEIEGDRGDPLARVLMLEFFALGEANVASCTMIEKK